MHRGDIVDFAFPPGHHDFLIHAALPVNQAATTPLADLARRACLRMLAFARQANAQRMLHISSGAVYGPLPDSVGAVDEDVAWQTGGPVNEYTLAKRMEESVLGSGWPGGVISARCFAFMGPGMDPASGTAAAQFLAAAARQEAVFVQGDGLAVRSYQYASDMARWLLTLLALGCPGRAYNVGSPEAISIAELAHRIHAIAGLQQAVQFKGAGMASRAPQRYVPSTRRATEEAGLTNHVGLDEAITRTLHWHAFGLAPRTTIAS
jgi:dTDP-glucose 4,6-dehydratase